jgi:3-oxoadipate enol-lactonase
MPTVHFDSNRINYDIRGAGPAALLFNHSGASAVGWSERFLEALAEELTVITFDYRGTGYSSPASSAFSLSDLAADAHAILETQSIDGAFIIGASMGGAVAQEFALALPGRVRALALLGTFAGQAHVVPPSPSVLKVVEALSMSMSNIERWRRLLPTIYSASFLEHHEDLALELELKGSRFMTEETIARHGAAVSEFELYERLTSISAPTLVIHGTADPIMPVENGRILARRIIGSTYVELDGVGHLPAVERPFDVAARILSFARQNDVGLAAN